jgi:hypothetical protein
MAVAVAAGSGVQAVSLWELLTVGLVGGRAVMLPRSSGANEWGLAYVVSVEREDGSGRCFNVRRRCARTGEVATVFVRAG